MSQRLEVTAGGTDPFVFTFWVSVITTGLILLGSIRVLQFPKIFFQWFMSTAKFENQKKEDDRGLEWMEKFINVLVLFGMCVALPALSTQLFYVGRTAPYNLTDGKNYRDTWWIVTLWMYATGAICIASGLTIEALPSLVSTYYSSVFENYKEFIRKATYTLVVLILFATPIAGMAINAKEMGSTVGNPTPVMFIISGILLVVYMIMEISYSHNLSHRSLEAAKKVLESSVNLKLPTETLMNTSTMVHLRPSADQSIVVASNSDAHLALDAAENFKKSSAENMNRFANGYALRSVNLDGTDNVYMMGSSAAIVFDKLVKPASLALVHEKNYETDDVEVLQINSAGNPLKNAMKNIRSVDLSGMAGRFDSEDSFLGITDGMVYSMLIEEKTIMLYSFYMLTVVLFTLRCSPTSMMLWVVVYGLPMVICLAPAPFLDVTELVDRRRQWAQLQMFFGCVGLSLFGLVYKIFPTLAFNDYYVTAVDIWQFANNDGTDFWYTGITTDVYANVEVVSILQLTVFGFSAYIIVTYIVTVMSYFNYFCGRSK